MSFKLPTTDQLREIGENLGMDITPDYADGVIRYLAPLAAGYRELLALPDDLPPVKYPRGGYYRPEGEENRYGAWIAKSRSRARPGASSPAKRSPSRIPMRSPAFRSPTAHRCSEGYVPEFDATGHHAAARCRRRDRRQIGVRIFLLLRWRGHEYHPARFITRAPGPHPRRLVDRLRRVGRALARSIMATGGDQAGSIRIPASLLRRRRHQTDLGPCSLYRHHGHGSDDRSCRTAHANVADNALLLEVMAGEDGYDSRQTRSQTRHLHQGDRPGHRRHENRRGSGRIWPIRFTSRRRCRRAGGRKALQASAPRSRKSPFPGI